MPFPSLSAHQGKAVDYTTSWLPFNFVSLTITKASLSGEWQLRVTHTPLPFIYHVHQMFSSTSNRESDGPRKVTRLNAGPPEALSLSRATVTRHLSLRMEAREASPQTALCRRGAPRLRPRSTLLFAL